MTCTRCFLHPALLLAAALVLQACSDSHPLMPVPAVYTGADPPPLFTTLAEARRTPGLDLLYVTNRALAEEPEEVGSPFGAERSQSLSFGTVTVAFSQDIDFATLAAESVAMRRARSLDMRLEAVHEQGRFPKMPYAIDRQPNGDFQRTPAVVAAHLAAEAALKAEVSRRLAAAPRKEVVLFIHGYNNTFADAALTASELCHFLGREFVCAIFSWPAGGTRGLFLGYNVDRESAEFSTLHLKQTLRIIASTPGLQGLHVIAHSRGTDLLASTIEQLMVESYVMGQPWSRRMKVRNVVLLAPDIDANVGTAKIFSVLSDPDLFYGGKPAPNVTLNPGDFRVSVYTSPDDRALSLSQWLFGSLRRLGRLNAVELTPEQVARATPLEGLFDFITVTGRTDLLGHSYFTSNPAVSADLIRLLRYGQSPGQGNRHLEHITGPFWRLLSLAP